MHWLMLYIKLQGHLHKQKYNLIGYRQPRFATREHKWKNTQKQYFDKDNYWYRRLYEFNNKVLKGKSRTHAVEQQINVPYTHQFRIIS
jgi:hypothetical protein